jgi:hypothetical protein
MAVRSKAQVWSSLIAGIAGSNPAEGMDVCLLCFFLCCVGSGLCEEMITLSEESYRMCVCVWSRYLNNEAAWAQFGLLCHWKN